MEDLRTRVLYIDDDQANLEVFARIFEGEVEVLLAANTQQAREILAQHVVHVVVTDQRMPTENGLDFLTSISEDYGFCAKVVLTAYSDRHVMRRAFQSNQIMDFILKPFEESDLLEVFKRGRNLYEDNLKKAKMAQDYENLRRELGQDRGSFSEIIGAESGLAELIRRVRKVATDASDATVLIEGESGTGKELIARAIHFHSARKDGPFIAVNCAALPETLWESELFGYEKGAFSGAVKRKLGRFELADRGTLFLDEVGEIPEPLQVKLLRVLQERVIERLGGTQCIPVNVRIITATNRNLAQEVKNGKFRQDLFFRLNVIPLAIPALREHPQDIPALLDHFLEIANRKTGKKCQINPMTLDQLKAYHWPGNVRELENLVERAVILSDHETLNLWDFIVDLEAKEEAERNIKNDLLETCGKPAWEATPSFRMELKREETEHYKSILRKSGGNISEAARMLGIHRRTLTDRLKKLELI